MSLRAAGIVLAGILEAVQGFRPAQGIAYAASFTIYFGWYDNSQTSASPSVANTLARKP